MDSSRTFLSVFVLLVGSILLAGCSNWTGVPPMHGNFMTEPVNHARVDAGAPPAGGNFIQQTAHDYAGLADYLAHHGHYYSGDWVDVDYFSRKGIAAEHGKLVLPENNKNWAIPLQEPFHFRTQMAQARVRLLNDLNHGGRDRFPGLAARAQVSYDCWLERTEDNWATGFNGACHKDFVTTLAALERALHGAPVAKPSPTHQYNVYFEFDRATLTPEAREVVDAVARSAKAHRGLRIDLVGKADHTGTDAYNMALSHRRALSVRARLHVDGVAVRRITMSWDGFRNPPVPNPPGVREPRNRVVEVMLH